MFRRIPGARLLQLLAGLAVITAPALAQEGHPLKGSWIGTWGPTAVHRNPVLLVLDWDGKTISGVINPGSDNIAIGKAEFLPDPAVTGAAVGWAVKFEAEAKDPSGTPIRYVIEGTLGDLLMPNRLLIGRWSHGKGSGDFRLRRQQ